MRGLEINAPQRAPAHPVRRHMRGLENIRHFILHSILVRRHMRGLEIGSSTRRRMEGVRRHMRGLERPGRRTAAR